MRLSKDHWGYGAEQIKVWEEDLTITKAYIETNEVWKLVEGDRIIGFFSYLAEPGEIVKLENLFILPKYIGQNIGKMMMVRFLSQVRDKGYQKVILDSDPNAAGFYTHFGFRVIDEIPTSIEGRFMPVMELNLAPI